ncbi:MAG: protein kinase [Planctomycetota bacterium]
MTDELRDDPILASALEIEGFKVLDPVVLFTKLGEGGMGAVYRGHHLKLDIPVAIKCLKPTIALENPELVGRFQREATVAASLDSENLVRVFDVHEFRGVHYLVMEFVEGETIRQRVQRVGTLDVPTAVAAIYEAARGLVEAHRRGIVHRDIKPDNIIIANDGRVKVADLGLAKAGDGLDGVKTRSGIVMGTPSYMPPEQFEDASRLGPRPTSTRSGSRSTSCSRERRPSPAARSSRCCAASARIPCPRSRRGAPRPKADSTSSTAWPPPRAPASGPRPRSSS